MNLSTLLKLGLVGAAGYYFFFRQQAAAAAAIPASTGDSTAPPAAPATAPPTATDATGTRALMLADALTEPAYIAGNGRMTKYQWDAVYRKYRGVAEVGDLGISDPSMLITLDEYWTAATRAGLAGRLRAAAPRRRSIAADAWSF